MKKIDWMRKLTSRKMWMSVASFVTLMIVAGATVIGYVIGEGLTDAAAIGTEKAEQEG